MRAVVVDYESRRLEKRDVREPAITATNQAMIQVHQAGVCGTDREIASFRIAFPPPGESYLTIGHEAVAQVLETGRDVKNVAPGDWVAPSVRRPFRSTLPGAVIALVTWLVLSSGLGLYLRNFSKLNKTYGTLAAAVALLLWLYWTAFAILVGAQFNAETMRKEEAASQAQGEPAPTQEQPASHPATAA